MNKILITLLLSSASIPAMADSYICSGNGIAHTVEHKDYYDSLNIDGIEYKQGGQSFINHGAGGKYSVLLVPVYTVIDGNHTVAITYKDDFKSPYTVANLDEIIPVNNIYQGGDITKVLTVCPVAVKRQGTLKKKTYVRDENKKTSDSKNTSPTIENWDKYAVPTPQPDNQW